MTVAVCPPSVPSGAHMLQKGTCWKRRLNFSGIGGGDVVEPPTPKRTCTPHNVNLHSAYVRTVSVVPKIFHNYVPISVTDVCVFPAIKSEGVKNMSHPFPPPHVVLSAPPALEGFQSAQVMLQNGQFHSHCLKGVDSKMPGVIYKSLMTGFQKVSSSRHSSGPSPPVRWGATCWHGKPASLAHGCYAP